MTTARASRVDFMISTSLSTMESAWMWAGAVSFSSANLVRLSSSRMSRRGRVHFGREGEIDDAHRQADRGAQRHDLDLPASGRTSCSRSMKLSVSSGDMDTLPFNGKFSDAWFSRRAIRRC